MCSLSLPLSLSLSLSPAVHCGIRAGRGRCGHVTGPPGEIVHSVECLTVQTVTGVRSHAAYETKVVDGMRELEVKDDR